MTNEQLYLAIGVPILFNTLVAVTLMYSVSATLGGRIDSQSATLGGRIDSQSARFDSLIARIDSLEQRMADGFAAVNQRFDDMRGLWTAELRRVEEVLDARLKHLEEHK